LLSFDFGVDAAVNRIQNKVYTYWMALPGLFLFGLFFLIPSVFGLLLSFTHTMGFDISRRSFAGFANYIEIFTEPEMRIAIFNTFIFAFITTFCKVLFGMILAVILNRQIRTSNALRTIFFLPAVINTVAVGLIFTAMMHPEAGLINRAFRAIGLGSWAQSWLADTHLAIFSVSYIEIWRWTGFCMVIILAGLQAIPKDIYEAADIDGVNTFQRFRYITFPLVLPAFNNAFVLSLVGGLKVFDLIQATTQGGPGYATQVFGTLVFKSFSNGQFGEGCAANILLTLVVSLFAIPVYRSIRSREVES
jgi:raffinose/stachyose/melibiose transport system permease protein